MNTRPTRILYTSRNLLRHVAASTVRAAALLALGLMGLSTGFAGPTLTFNLGSHGAGNGTTFQNVQKSGAGNGTSYVIGMTIAVTDVGGTPMNYGTYATFCTELAESINFGIYSQFEVVHLENATAGTAGRPGTASSLIPLGGIGATAAGQIRYLFDHYYISTNINDWTAKQAQAFQLAVWEIGHDYGQFEATDLSLSSGAFRVGTQTGTGSAARFDAIALAQSYLTAIDTANIDGTYYSQLMKVWALVDDNGVGPTTGYQDILLASPIGTAQEQALTPILPAPEPSTIGLILLGLAGAGVFRRTRRI